MSLWNARTGAEVSHHEVFASKTVIGGYVKPGFSPDGEFAVLHRDPHTIVLHLRAPASHEISHISLSQYLRFSKLTLTIDAVALGSAGQGLAIA